jgi:hypothetical protein
MAQGSLSIKVSDYFSDGDILLSGDSLTYTIKQATGALVGSWVVLHPTTGILTFIAGLSNVGWNYFQVTATDKQSASLTQPFGLLVNSKP